MNRDLGCASPAEFRHLVRSGEFRGSTAGVCRGYAQANLVILPESYAYDFLVYAHRNPKPCPVIDVTDPGDPHPPWAAPGADLRTDLPAYRIYGGGRLEGEARSIQDIWQHDMVSFLLGCSFTFERALMAAGVPVRHMELNRTVPMYVTSLMTMPAGRFQGPVVVTMRPIPHHLVTRAVAVTARYTRAHGAPLHIGDPSHLGIESLDRPDFGDAVPIYEGEVPVFWACGVTSQLAVAEANVALAVTHSPGHMLVCDRLDEELTAS